VEQASALAGRSVTAESLLADTHRRDERWRTVLPSRTAQLADVSAATSDAELLVGSAWAWRQSGSVASHPWMAADGVDRQLAAVSARASGELTEWDGLVGADVIERPVGTAISPTSLERWATCPRRYLFENVLHVRHDQQPVDDDVLNALDRGALVHEVLETVVREQIDDPSLVPGSARLRDRALEILEQLCDAAEAAGRTGRGLPWQLGRHHLTRELVRFIGDDARYREEHGLVPSHVEVPFGLEPGDLPVTVDVEGGPPLAFRGIIDRLDVSTDGSTVVVTDYKTGKALTDGDVAAGAAGGTLLQLPIYGLAARQLVPGATTVKARYWYLFGNGPWHSRELLVDREAVDQLRTVAGTITAGIAAGVFPARPGKVDRTSYEHCTFCPFDRVCPPERRLSWDRKQQAAALAPVRQLVESADEARRTAGRGRSSARAGGGAP
jgi:RecB family exonuclease